jgi:uridine kinase
LFNSKRIFFTATGSSIPSSLYGSQFCSENLDLPSQFLPNGGVLSMDFRNDDLVFLSTQGFNRGDSELVVKKIKNSGAKLAVLTANQESPFINLADFVFYFSPFPEKLFCRPVGVQTAILAMQKILTNEFDSSVLTSILEKTQKIERQIFDPNTKYIVLSSGVCMPVAINYSLALREGCGIDSNFYDIETYGHGMYVSDQTLQSKGQKLCYILINITANDHCKAACERIKPFIVNSKSGLICIDSTLPLPYAYLEILTNLAENVYSTNVKNQYDMNEPFGKEENRYYHQSQTYKLPNRHLENFIENIKQKSKTTKNPILVQISGGSCTGKSTFIHKIKNELGISQIISQDDYQLGKNFEQRKTSIYKYDDPRNFQVEKCFADMKTLLNSEKVTIPTFNLVENRQTSEMEFEPQKINLLEGVYSSFEKLASLSEFKIYIEAPYYLRFLRRITRFINNNQNPDTTIPLGHITSFVYLAHKDFVIKQKETADLILQADEILPEFVNILDEDIAFEEILFQKENTEIGFGENRQKLLIHQNQKLVYQSEISPETKDFLLRVDWLEV